jgi:DNA repair photolyase
MNKITEVFAKSVLTPSQLPGADFVINPYSGCQFGCVYCYADFMRRFTGHVDDKWGDYVDVRVNAAVLLEKELRNLSKRVAKSKIDGKVITFKGGDRPIIFLSSVTDPYQNVESKYKLTRNCIEVLLKSDLDFELSILTKSQLITRDIDLLKRVKHLEVGMTITSTDDSVGRLFEVFAPSVSQRIRALTELNSAGIKTFAFIGPLLPHFVADEKILRDLLMEIKKAGTTKVWFEHINLRGNKLGRLTKLVGEKLNEETMQEFKNSQVDIYKEKLNTQIKRIVKDLDLEIVGGDVMDHGRR